MKLVEILARELDEWPKDARSRSITQDNDRAINLYSTDKPSTTQCGGCWNVGGFIDYLTRSDALATDHSTAIVTRADWEAERAKLKAAKANGDGWIRHRGGKCPVDAGTLVDVRHRDGDIFLGERALEGRAGSWVHRRLISDIMRYRIHKPVEQPEIKLESGAEISYSPGEPLVSMEPVDTMLAIRDRIRELDTQRAEVESTYQRQISEITQGRESLVQKLAGEGLALSEVVVQPVEDMSDWRNWKAGDLIRHVGEGWRDFTRGVLYQLTDVNETAVFLDDDVGPRILNVDSDTIFPNGDFPAFKWHSRPAS